MRHIGSIPVSDQAEKFSAFLTIQGIANQVELDGQHYDVWVKEEDRLEQATQYLEEFQQHPGDQKYEQAIIQARSLLQQEIEKRKQIQKNVVNVRERWPAGQKRRAPLCLVLIGISVLVGLVTSFGHVDPSNLSAGLKALSFNYVEGEAAAQVLEARTSDDDPRLRLASVLRGEFWRIFTPIFIHFGPIHLLFNMIWMFQLGRLLEDRWGTPFFAMLIVMTAVIPNFLQATVPELIDGSAPAEELFAIPVIFTVFGGMSGVVYGLFGFAWIRSSLDPSAGFMIPPSTVVILLGWMLLGFSTLDEQWFGIRMANWGHGGGLVVGMLIAYFSVLRNRSSRAG